MARPQKEGMDYFPHDTDATSDEKIEALRTLYGNDGYAFYFILLERIFRSPEAELDVSATEMLQILASKVSVTIEKFTEMLETALKWHCFDPVKYRNGHILTSSGIKKRAEPVFEKRLQTRLKYHKDIVSTPVSPTETTTETTQKRHKVKESKVKESKVDKIDNNIVEIVKLYEDNIGMITPMIREELLDIANESTVLWFGEAVKIACGNNVRRLSYIRTILENWKRAGFKAEKGKDKSGQQGPRIVKYKTGN